MALPAHAVQPSWYEPPVKPEGRRGALAVAQFPSSIQNAKGADQFCQDWQVIAARQKTR